MKDLLKQISKNTIALNSENFTEQEKQNVWIGKKPCIENEIAKTEKKLGIKLPKDVIDFYKISNGTSVILNQTFGGFEPIDKIDWMKNMQPQTFIDYEEMGEDYVNHLKNSIIIAGHNYPHQVLIIQPFAESKEWKYWEFASYIPGENEFDGIEKYLERLNDFLSEQIKNKNETNEFK